MLLGFLWLKILRPTGNASLSSFASKIAIPASALPLLALVRVYFLS